MTSNILTSSTYQLYGGALVRTYVARIGSVRVLLDNSAGLGSTYTAVDGLRTLPSGAPKSDWGGVGLRLGTSLRASYDFRRWRLLGSFAGARVDFGERQDFLGQAQTSRTSFSASLLGNIGLGAEFRF